MTKHDPLAGSDTYDILGKPASVSLEARLRSWSILEQHDLLQIPDWSVEISKLLAATAREIEHLRAACGPISPGLSHYDIRLKIQADLLNKSVP